jgi:hypothetical protein
MAGGREAHRARWVGVVEAWRRSGLTQVAFAEARGLRLDTLRAWCRRLGENPRRASSSPGSWPRGTPAGPALVEVVSAGRTERAGAELDLGGGLVLRFLGDAAPGFVGAVVAVVRAGVC